MSDTTSSSSTRYAVYSVDGVHEIYEARTPSEALRRWIDEHGTWTVAGAEGALEVPVRWRAAKHLIIDNRLSVSEAYAHGTFVMPAFKGIEEREFTISVHCTSEMLACWHLAMSTDTNEDPANLPWEMLNAWDDDALFREIADRTGDEIDVGAIANSELGGVDHPSDYNAAVPPLDRVFSTAEQEIFWARRF